MKILLNLHKTQLLISVTNLKEARLALENGADLIDLKDPNAGALGALPISVVRSVVAYVKQTDRYRSTSATIGDVPMQSDTLRDRVKKMQETNVDYIKIGFFETSNYQASLNALSHLAKSGVKLIAVLFAEMKYPDNLIQAITQAGFVGVMLDTAEKNGLNLLDYFDDMELLAFVQNATKSDLIVGLAGSLKSQHIALLKKLNPTYLGFRGGVCEGDLRYLSLQGEKIQQIKRLLVD